MNVPSGVPNVCAGCGGSLLRRSQKRFCSIDCQRASDRRANVERWLATGHAPYPGQGDRHYIRGYLLGQQARRCAICSAQDHWNGAQLTLVLDHIDGNASNNARDNLRLVCPNCDSQLPTYKARNRGNGRAWRRLRYADGKSY